MDLKTQELGLIEQEQEQEQENQKQDFLKNKKIILIP